jgi:AcrR family transcriptional regulator
MGSRERREREREETRSRILDAARDLFADEGFEAVSMRRIADRIEYSATAIYHHFPDKESLFRELVVQDFLALAGALTGLSAVDDPLERIRLMGLHYVRFAIEHPNHYRFMFMSSSPVIALDAKQEQIKGDPSLDAYAFLRATCAEAIERGVVRADITDADLLAQVCWSGVHGVAALSIDKCDDPWIPMRDPGEIARALTATMVLGLRRPAPAREDRP